MAHFLYVLKPRRAKFLATITKEETNIMEDHYAYLQELHRTGTLVLAGPCLDGAYGIVILEAATEVDAALISENDPSVVSGVMDVELHPYRISLWRQP